MKVVILSGGFGTRLGEETLLKPKPMIEIGEKPILWHIMNIYSSYGFKDFILALGYKAEVIKEYFLNYYYHQSDLMIDLKSGKVKVKNNKMVDWNIELIDTGLHSMTGGRLRRLKNTLGNQTFMLTYGDGVCNINLKKLLRFHDSHGKIATVTAVRPVARFGGMDFNGDKVIRFKEKTQTTEGWINGGFFIFEPQIFKYLERDDSVLEAEPLERLAKEEQLVAFKHSGFWQCMDTMRDKNLLESMWASGKAPWKIW